MVSGYAALTRDGGMRYLLVDGCYPLTVSLKSGDKTHSNDKGELSEWNTDGTYGHGFGGFSLKAQQSGTKNWKIR